MEKKKMKKKKENKKKKKKKNIKKIKKKIKKNGNLRNSYTFQMDYNGMWEDKRTNSQTQDIGDLFQKIILWVNLCSYG